VARAAGMTGAGKPGGDPSQVADPGASSAARSIGSCDFEFEYGSGNGRALGRMLDTLLPISDA
jgi:hypothetical protein